MMHDFKQEIDAACHALKERTCECGHVAVPEAGIPDTQFGQHAMSIMAGPRRGHSSPPSAARMPGSLGMKTSKRSVRQAPVVLSDRPNQRGMIWGIRQDMAASGYLKLDETTCLICGRQGRIPACVGGNSAIFHADAGRSRAVIPVHFPLTGKPATADGCPAYAVFGIIRRCWARILRDARFGAVQAAGPEAVEQTASKAGAGCETQCTVWGDPLGVW